MLVQLLGAPVGFVVVCVFVPRSLGQHVAAGEVSLSSEFETHPDTACSHLTQVLTLTRVLWISSKLC